jgi:hypothetical protein
VSLITDLRRLGPTQAFEDHPVPEMRLAFALLLYTGQRRSDVVNAI